MKLSARYSRDDDATATGPLAGIRVADFSVHAAGPFAGLMLAEMGAQVIKVESSARLDITRRPHAMYGKPPSSFEQINANKLSVCLNLKEPRAVELALRLVGVSELALENFRPGVMSRLGLGYEEMRAARPDIILVSLSSNGQGGPESNYAGYAPMFAALGGLGHLTGYADGPPVELRHAMDHTGGMLAAFAAVAALSAKQRTGLGQHVDVSVRDLASAFMGPELLDVAMNSREPLRQGNRDNGAAPQGVYQCAGDDEWVSISVGSEGEWKAFVAALDSPEWTADEKFGDAFRRWKNHDELDGLIEEWTSQRTAAEVTSALQSKGVAAFTSLSPLGLMQDEHLAARSVFPTVHNQSISGRETGEKQRAVAPPWKLSRTPAAINRWTPELGQDNLDVFSGILGLPEEEVRELEKKHIIW